MPLSRYIDCICDNNLFALVITGTPTIEQLSEAWENIRQQVAEVGGGDTSALLKSLFKEVIALQAQHNEITGAVEALRLIMGCMIASSYDLPDEILEEQKALQSKLNTLLKSNFKFNIWDGETYHRELHGCIIRGGSIKIKLDLRTMAYEQVKEKLQSKDDTPMTRQYFDKLLINISDYSKYDINEEITVSKFYERVKRFNDYCKSLSTK